MSTFSIVTHITRRIILLRQSLCKTTTPIKQFYAFNTLWIWIKSWLFIFGKLIFGTSIYIVTIWFYEIIIFMMVSILILVLWITWWVSFDPQKMPPLTTSSSLYIYTLLLLSEMNNTYDWSSLNIISVGKILTHHGCHIMDGRAFLFA